MAKGYHSCNFVTLCTLGLASSLALESLLLVLKKESAMNPKLQDECWWQPYEQGSMPFLAEFPDEKPTLAETLTVILGDPQAGNPTKPCPGS